MGNRLKISWCSVDRVFNVYLNSKKSGNRIGSNNNKNVAIAEAREYLIENSIVA